MTTSNNNNETKESFLERFDLCLEDQRLMNYINYEVYIIDRNYTIVYANNRKRQKAGHNIIGQKCFNVFPKGRDELQSHCPNCPCKDVLFGNRKSVVFDKRELLDKDGKSYFVCESSSPLFDSAGNVVLAMNVVKDITRETRIENIKKDIQNIRDYQECVRSIVDGINKSDYLRVRYYDYIYDRSRNDYLFVGRYAQGMQNMGIDFVGYRFYESDTDYLPNIGTERKAMFQSGEIVLEQNPECVWVRELGLENEKWIDLPLVVAGKLIGAIAVDNKGGRDLDKEDLYLLADLARYSAQALENSFSFEVVQVIQEISCRITQNQNNKDILSLIVKDVCTKLKALECSIFIFDDETKFLTRREIYISGCKISATRNMPTERYRKGEYITGAVYEDIEPISIIDLKQYGKGGGKRVNWKAIQNFQNFVKKHIGENIEIRNALFAPILIDEKKKGVLRASNNLKYGNIPFHESDLDVLSTIANQLGVILGNIQLLHSISAEKLFSEGIINAAPDSVMVTERKRSRKGNIFWEIIHANKAAHDMFAHSQGALIGKNALNLYDQTTKQEIRERLRPYRKGTSFSNLKGKFKMRTGRYKDINLSLSILDDKKTLGICKDFSPDRTILENLQGRRDELKRINKKIRQNAELVGTGRMATYVAHDAKNVLGDVSALISTVLMEVPRKRRDDEQLKIITEAISSNIKKVGYLLNSLLGYASRKNLHLVTTSINKLMDSFFKSQERTLEKRGIKHKIEYNLKDIQFRCDPFHIEAMIMNLYNNSVYSIFQKGKSLMKYKGAIWLRIRAVENRLEIYFHDNGEGITKENLNKIFEPTFTTKKGKGTGLGLAIVKRIIEINAGEISVESEVGIGTTFTIVLRNSRGGGI